MTKTNARSVEFLNMNGSYGSLAHTVTGLGPAFQISVRETKGAAYRIQPQKLGEILDETLQVRSYFITLVLGNRT